MRWKKKAAPLLRSLEFCNLMRIPYVLLYLQQRSVLDTKHIRSGCGNRMDFVPFGFSGIGRGGSRIVVSGDSSL